MNKKGFSLLELLAVVIIISLIAMVTVPLISNQLANNKDKISDASLKIIYEATDLYMSDKISSYPKSNGNTYCVTLDQLVNENYLKSPIKDFNTGSNIELTKGVKSTVKDNQYSDFKLVNNC